MSFEEPNEAPEMIYVSDHTSMILTGEQRGVLSSFTDSQPAETGDTHAVEEEEVVEPIINSTTHCRRSLQIFIILALVTIVLWIIIDASTTGYVPAWLFAFLHWIQENPISGIFCFCIVYFFATIFFVPSSILTLGAGFAFGNAFSLALGVLLGTISVFCGAYCGAMVAFLLARYLLRDSVVVAFLTTKRFPVVAALDTALQNKGLYIMILLRLSPIVPFSAINYIAGVSAISVRDFSIALLATLPGTVVFVFLGASAGSLVASSQATQGNAAVLIVVSVVGVVFGLAAILVTSFYAKQELATTITAAAAAAASDNEEEEESSLNSSDGDTIEDPEMQLSTQPPEQARPHRAATEIML